MVAFPHNRHGPRWTREVLVTCKDVNDGTNTKMLPSASRYIVAAYLLARNRTNFTERPSELSGQLLRLLTTGGDCHPRNRLSTGTSAGFVARSRPALCLASGEILAARCQRPTNERSLSVTSDFYPPLLPFFNIFLSRCRKDVLGLCTALSRASSSSRFRVDC
jgi:hypothetical protein